MSADLNYRKKLWFPEKANRVMTELVEYVDVAIGNEEDAEKVFGIKAEASDVTKGELSLEGYRKVASELVKRLGFEITAVTLRESLSASDNGWSGMLCDDHDFYQSRKHYVHIVNRVDGGDSFAAGLICALLTGASSQEALEFAIAASCLKHSILGDFSVVSAPGVQGLATGDAAGRIEELRKPCLIRDRLTS